MNIATSDIQPIDKFIAYMDVLGFSSLVRASERGQGLPFSELTGIIAILGTDEDRKRFEKHGPHICPQAQYLRRDLDFQITQMSDCVWASAEVSPAGLINLIEHCWNVQLNLLTKGLMCRGYITRGNISSNHQIGTGLIDAVEGERQVSIFKKHIDESGTPFIEIDQKVIEYVQYQTDDCVKKMYKRMITIEGNTTALFPFKRLNHSFIVAGPNINLQVEKERTSINTMRSWIYKMKEQVMRHVDNSNSKAVSKRDHYIHMLEAQLIACDKTEEILKRL